jgi:hypothetical protein
MNHSSRTVPNNIHQHAAQSHEPFTNITTLSPQVPSHMIEGRDCIDCCLSACLNLYPFSLLSLSLIARHQYPTPLLYPVHRVTTSLFLVLSRIPLSTSRILSRYDHHAPETHSTNPDTKPISYDLLPPFLNTVVVIDIETYPPTCAYNQASRRRPCLTPHRPIQACRCSVLTTTFPLMRVLSYAPAFFFLSFPSKPTILQPP